jgi:hypothetical protein
MVTKIEDQESMGRARVDRDIEGPGSAGETDPFRALGYPPAPDRSCMSNEQFT